MTRQRSTEPAPTTTTATGKAPSTNSVNFKGVPVRVDSVHVEGLGRTKDDYVQSQLKDLFKVTTFEDLMVVSAEVRQRLEKLECFREIGILIDTNKTKDATPNGYDVTFRVTEFRRFVGQVNTMVGANDGSLTFGLKLPNVAGRGERVNVDHTVGSTYNNKTSTLSVMKPIPGALNMTTMASLFHQTIPNTLSGYLLRATGSLLDVSFESARHVRHSLQYEGSWRHLEASSRTTSFPVRLQSGHSFKSALRHILTVDNRDDQVFPTKGILLKLAQEFAGLGGDAAFVKHDSELQLNVGLPYELAVQGILRFGVLRPLDNSVLSHNIHDMFFLGGPAGPWTLRGFNMKSIGSRSGTNFLGGRAYWSSGLHLFSPLPLGVGQGGWGDYFRAHAFINVGNITDSDFTPEDFGDTCRRLLQNFRAAYGLGFALRLGHSARIELNYCFPLKFYTGDSIVHGISLGVSFMG